MSCNCKEYILTNTTSNNLYFNYRKCDDVIFESQVLLEPQQVKTIWLIDNSYSCAFSEGITIVDNGCFPSTGTTSTPSVTPTCTPTYTPTPSITPTITPTETNTPTPTETNTPTPTETNTPTPTPTSTEIPPAFISTWQTTSPNETIELPYSVSGTYSGTIDWGDGSTSVNSYADRAHTYVTPGTYTISITGVLNIFNFTISSFATNLLSVTKWGILQNGIFQGCSNLNLTGVTDTLNLDGISNIGTMFRNCTSLTYVNRMDEWNMSGVTNMAYMFDGCSNFDQDLGSWDVSNVTTMGHIFGFAYLFNNGGSSSINNWDTSSVTDIQSAFWYTTSFNQPLSGWNVSNVQSFGSTFGFSNFNQDISNWNTQSATGMGYMFYHNTQFNQDIGNWNVSGVTSMGNMFNTATSFNQDLSGWCVTNIPSTPPSFASGATAWVLPKPVWGTCPP